jgi:hypothetical protein
MGQMTRELEEKLRDIFYPIMGFSKIDGYYIKKKTIHHKFEPLIHGYVIHKKYNRYNNKFYQRKEDKNA